MSAEEVVAATRAPTHPVIIIAAGKIANTEDARLSAADAALVAIAMSAAMTADMTNVAEVVASTATRGRKTGATSAARSADVPTRAVLSSVLKRTATGAPLAASREEGQLRANQALKISAAPLKKLKTGLRAQSLATGSRLMSAKSKTVLLAPTTPRMVLLLLVVRRALPSRKTRSESDEKINLTGQLS